MAEANETRAFYKVVSDFNNLRRDLTRTRQELAKTQAAEKAFNAASVKDRAASTKAATTRAKALASENVSLKAVLSNLTKYRERQRSLLAPVVAATKAINAQNRALKSNATNLSAAAIAAKAYADAQKSISRSTGVSSDALRTQKEFAKAQRKVKFDTDDTTESIKKQNVAIDAAHKLRNRFKGTGKLDNFLDSRSLVRFREEGNKLAPVFRQIEMGGKRAFDSLQKFGNWRPRLVPPFVALIPIIGAVIAALNPLVSLLGAVGGAAIGLSGQIGSLAGAFLALPGILSAVAAGIGGVIASMGGVGNVFKTYGAMQKALGKSPGSGGGQTQEERAEALADAERNLAKAQRNVQKAQENLNKAREEALKDLIDLRQEVGRASLTEERAIADLRLAQEAYWNVMADPGSTLGDKLDAAAKIKEAEADLQDVRKKNIKNQKDLVDAEKKGINQSDKVLDAQESLADAYDAQRKAQRALKTESAGGSSAVQALNDYNAALNELSPSARRFVLAIIGMQDQWKAFRKDLQEEFFGRFVDDLDLLPQALRNLSAFLKPAVGAMGDLAGAFLRMFTSPEWSRDMATIGEQNGDVIRNLGDAALSLSTALKDIVIAAGPFTDWLTGKFAEGAANFSDFVADARETGSLAGWLDNVADRLERWWTIVKNIGRTVFNFSSAASEFGDWITDGLLEMTENWVKFSEEQTKPNSPFKKWLEDIKPLLQAVDDLLGAFFSWFAEEAADPENIQSAIDLLKILTDDVGPALARLMDTLADTDIDEAFLKALTSIIESIDTIMENGGSAAFETFFDIVTGFFEGVAEFTSQIPKPVLEGLLSLLGFLAGVTFVGKFTGLTSLLGAILGFSGKTTLFAAISTMVKDFGKLDKMKFSALLGKAGLLAGIASLIVVTWNQNQNTQPFQDSLGNALTDPTKENVKNARDEGIKDGNGLKWLTGPTSPLNILTGGQSLVNLGAISEILHFIDDLMGTNLAGEFDNFLQDIMQGLNDFSTDVGKWIDSTFLPMWNGFWGGIGTGFGTTWNVVTANWNKFTQTLSANWNKFSAQFKIGWDSYWGGIRNGWNSFWGGVGATFQGAVNNLANVWSGIQEKFRGPANWVISNVWNKGILTFWNNVAGRLGLAKIAAAPLIGGAPKSQGTSLGKSVGSKAASRYAKGGVYGDQGVLPGYTPGRDVHTFHSNTGGTLKLSGGEAIMRPEFTKLVGGIAGVNALNSKARKGQLAFATGGVYQKSMGSSIGKKAGTTLQKKADKGGDLDSLGRIFTDPVGFVGDGLKKVASTLLSGMSNDGWSGVVKNIPSKLIDGMVGNVKSWFSANPSGGGAGANNLGWQRQWAIIQKQFPSARLTSAYRSPGGNAAVGGVKGSYHTQGRAIDVTPSMEIFNWIRKNFPNSRELIYSPAGGRQLQNGQNKLWGEPVRSNHWDHVHWAMKNGGVIPGLYDNGGWLPHGGLAVNKSGKPEAVLDPQESRALKALLGGSGLMGRSTLGSSPASVLSQGAPKITDNSINIDKVIMNNPVPEKPSTSLPKAIRNIAYMSLARTGSDS